MQSKMAWVAWVVFLILNLSIACGFSFPSPWITTFRRLGFQRTSTRLEKVQYSGVGDVLLSKLSEADPLLHRSAIYIYHSGIDEVQGVMLDFQTTHKMGDVVKDVRFKPFSNNPVFIGGKNGSETALMFHRFPFTSMCRNLGDGVYLGGLHEALAAVDEQRANPFDFKFICKYMVWKPEELAQELSAGRWTVARVPAEMIVRNVKPTGKSLWEEFAELV